MCGKCVVCGSSSETISSKLGVCKRCIINKPEEALEVTDRVHAESRAIFTLPPKPPRSEGGVRCGFCANNCVIPEGEKGYCGLVFNEGGKLVRVAGTPDRGLLEWYYDPLPTNCVAWWFCAGCTGAGYPKYAYKQTAEYGYSNLAVFMTACSFDCLFCQNWHFRRSTAALSPVVSAEELASKATPRVSCICWFGGDPSPQMPYALRVSRLAYERAKDEGRIMRICWETNGYMAKRFADEAAQLSLESGGTFKFDLKAWSEPLSIALCGVSNKPVLKNFERIAKSYFSARDVPWVVTASTLLVPGYVDAEEVGKIAELIASIDERIPYTLLAFYPQYVMNDLPTTSKKQAQECRESAERAGLKNIRIGNIHLLS